MPSDGNRSDGSTRRNFIKAGVVGGTAMLAGCSGGSGPGGSGPEGRFNVFDPLTSGATPSERHFNPWNPTQTGAWHPGAAVFDRLAVYSPTKNEAYPLIAQEWEMSDDTTLEVTLSDEWTWHNGDQFVAQDWVMQQEIDIALRGAANPDVENPHPVMSGVEAVDDTHIRVNLHTPLSEIFAVQNTIATYNGNLARGVFTKHDDDQWSDWHERLTNNEPGSDAMESVVGEITSTKYPMIDEGIGHGPFQISEVGDDIIICEIYDDHPNAGNLQIDEFALKLFTSTNQPVQPYSSGQVDAAHKGFPVQEDLRAQMPDGHTLFREGRSSNKLFAFNNGYETDADTWFSSRNVRRAVAHVFDRQQVSSLLQGVNRLFDYPPCRVPGKVMEDESHQAASFVKENFVKYGQNNTERAAELLREDGFSREGGTWYTPDGNEFEVGIMNGAERPDFTVLSQNLEDFGVTVNQEQVDDATFDERRTEGRYDIMPDGSSANGVSALWALGLVPDWIQSITHFDPNPEIPMPIGDPSGSQGTKQINVAEHIRSWQSTNEDQYHQELMWWWNQYLPEAEMMYQPDAGAYNGDSWELDVRDGIKNGVDDALYIAPKMEEGVLRQK